ncbi:MAG: hypothetical protein CL910_11100 [Deltaproteobacteria bacterium]|nr:hypothetical protein [Deltaproteobacteria bacterium]
MAEYSTEREFEMSAEALWAVVRDFGEVDWLPGNPTYSSEGTGPGMIRTIDMPPIPTVREQLEAIDEDERRVSYRILEGLPMPLTGYRAAMQVVDAGGGRSRLVWSSQWEPDGVTEEEARAVVANMYDSVMGVMKANLEKG